MVKTEPPATMPDVAPIARTLTFSSSVDARRFRNAVANAEKPTARIEIGIADSMPWPSFSALYVAAAEKTIDQKKPWTTERVVISCAGREGGMTGSYVSPGASSRNAFSGRRD